MTDYRKSSLRRSNPLRWLISFLVFGCAPIYQYPAPTAFPGLSPETIVAEIFRLEDALLTETSTSARTDHLWKLAILYAHPDNPKPDYKTAIARVEALSALSPAKPDKEVIRYMSGLFRELDSATSEMNRLRAKTSKMESSHKKALLDLSRREGVNTRKLKEEADRSQKEIEHLKNINEELEKKVQSLEEKLETLKRLDLRMEERKRF